MLIRYKYRCDFGGGAFLYGVVRLRMGNLPQLLATNDVGKVQRTIVTESAVQSNS